MMTTSSAFGDSGIRNTLIDYNALREQQQAPAQVVIAPPEPEATLSLEQKTEVLKDVYKEALKDAMDRFVKKEITAAQLKDITAALK
jgi:hypothetical protein